LKIFLSFLQSEKQYPIPSYKFWEHYIKNGITEAGHEWMECPGADWALGLVPQSKEDHLKWKQDIWAKTIAWLKKNPADVFLSYLYPYQVDKSAIKQIQSLGIPCVNFFCDHIRNYKKVPAEFAVFDLNWVPECKAATWYNEAGYPYLNLPMPMWIDPQYRVLKEEANKQITFIGSVDIQRQLLFEEVIVQAPDLPLAVYGSGWKGNNTTFQPAAPGYNLSKKIRFNLDFIAQQGLTAYRRKMQQRNMDTAISTALSAKIHEAPAFEQYNQLTAESMITLGVNRYPSFSYPLVKPDSYSRLRDIEAPMLGACYLAEYTEGIENLYDTENEIAVYKNAEALITIAKELQADPHKRKKLKVNGQKRALNDHSIPVSLGKILSALGLKTNN
jgi:Glycosyl transferases group 1